MSKVKEKDEKKRRGKGESKIEIRITKRRLKEILQKELTSSYKLDSRKNYLKRWITQSIHDSENQWLIIVMTYTNH